MWNSTEAERSPADAVKLAPKTVAQPFVKQ